MTPLLAARLPACDPARFARLEAGLLAGGAPGPVLLIAAFDRPVLLLGRHQRAASAVDVAAARGRGLAVARRAGGGRAVVAGEGTAGIFLYAPAEDRLVPGPFPPDRAMNRYVRGLLEGLRRLGARGAAYFGRDEVTDGGRRLALVSQEGTAGGALAFEAVLGVARPAGAAADLSRYPPHGDARAGGAPPASLHDVAGSAPAFEALGAALEAGWAAAAGREVAPLGAPLAEAALPPAEEDESGLAASGPFEIPIGFAEALSGLAGGRLVAPRLRGDFIAPAHLVAAWEAALDGAPLDAGEVGGRIDGAWHRAGAFVHGLRSLGVLADAVMAAGRAAGRATGRA